MGAMNAPAHLLTVLASEDIEELWDFLDELAQRDPGGAASVGVHSLGADDHRRYCVHPDGQRDFEVRGDDLHETLKLAAAAKVQRMDPNDLWRRDG